MPHQCTLDQLRENFETYLHLAEQGTPIEIFRNDQRIAVLQPAPERTPTPAFWQLLQTYRQTFNIDQNGLKNKDWANLRDPSPGRNVDL